MVFFLGVVIDYGKRDVVIAQPPKQQYPSRSPVHFQEHWYYQHLDHQLLYSAPLIIVSNNNNIACTLRMDKEHWIFIWLKPSIGDDLHAFDPATTRSTSTIFFGWSFWLHLLSSYIDSINTPTLKTLGRGVKIPWILNCQGYNLPLESTTLYNMNSSPTQHPHLNSPWYHPHIVPLYITIIYIDKVGYHTSSSKCICLCSLSCTYIIFWLC